MLHGKNVIKPEQEWEEKQGSIICISRYVLVSLCFVLKENKEIASLLYSLWLISTPHLIFVTRVIRDSPLKPQIPKTQITTKIANDGVIRFAIIIYIVAFAVYLPHWNVRYFICGLSRSNTITANMLHLHLWYLQF